MAASRVWSYVTDVEGNVNYWNNFINISRVVNREEDGRLTLKENSGFIFGGDSVDKGNGDIRVVRDLLQLQRDYPDRVHLIIGNRDANKLRFSSELENEKTLGIDYWTPPAKRTTLQTFLKKQNLEDSKVNRLKWMFIHTMGTTSAFDDRKDELAILGKENSDEDVLASFVSSVSPTGDENFMFQYLQAAKLMVRIGNTLVVHGGVNNANIGTVPGDSDIRESVDDWARDLNAWKQSQLDDYVKQPTWEELPDPETGRGVRGGDGLMDYGVPGGNGGKTVVYSNYLNNGNAVDVQNETIEYLSKSGINRVIVGHQPHGDCPTVINNNSKVQILTADTSYSNMKAPDNRGAAVSEILIHEADQTIEVHGILKDEQMIAYNLACPTKEAKGDYFVGQKLQGDWWVKSKLAPPTEDDKQYLACKGEGYKLDTQLLSPEELKTKL